MMGIEKMRLLAKEPAYRLLAKEAVYKVEMCTDIENANKFSQHFLILGHTTKRQTNTT